MIRSFTLFIASPHNLVDADDPAGIVRAYLAALAPGPERGPGLGLRRGSAGAFAPAFTSSPIGSFNADLVR